MIQLSPNFAREEFEKDGPMPDECVPAYTILCTDILEKIRAQFNNSPVVITSGYRSQAVNAAVHGVQNSEHIATAEWCAADFFITGESSRAAFDWIRMSDLPFHQVILEHGSDITIIHISWNETAPGKQALEGATYNESPYVAWPVGAGY